MVFLVESINKPDKTELVLFSRDKNGKKTIKRVNDFRPYFYAPEDDPVPSDYRITEVKRGFKAIDGKRVKKIYTRRSRDVNAIRKMFTKYYEADIMFDHRYRIDVLGEQEVNPLKTLYLDIELDTRETFPDLENPDQAVTVIAATDSFTNKDITFFYQHPDAPVKVEEREGLKVYDSEEDMLMGFIAYFKKCDPDVISGWNVEYFDLVYLLRRMQQFDLPYRKLSPLGTAYVDDKWGDVTIKGRIILDMMKAYKHFRFVSNQGRAESYSLEYTTQNVLNTGKLPNTENFHDTWFNDPEHLIEYNMRDTKLVKELNDKLQIIEFFHQITNKACSPLNRIYYSSTLVDGLLLRRVHGKIVLPSRSYDNDETDKYGGALVFPSTPGLYKNSIALDVKAMYPNIIKTFNMGFETFNPDGEIQISEGVGFDRGIGLISETVRDLEGERAENKRLMREAESEEERQFYDFRQYSVKVLTNAIYGYLGYKKSRLYKKEVAGAVTHIGQELIRWTQDRLRDYGYEILYGDTDSVYFKAKKTDLLGLLGEGKELMDKLNGTYEEFAKQYGADDCTLQIEFEKIFKRILFVGKKGSDEGAKKKYAYLPLWMEDNPNPDQIKYTGFEAVRSDTPRIARTIQKDVLEMILRGKERDEVVEYLQNIERKIREREVDDEEFGFPRGITRHLEDYSQPHPVVKGALYSNKYLGTQFTKGSKPKWVYIQSVPPGYPKIDSITFETEIPEGFEPDYDKINDRIFRMKLEEIFNAVGWDFPILNSSIKKLDKWGF